MNGTKIGRDYDGDSGSTAAVFDFNASKSSQIYGKSYSTATCNKDICMETDIMIQALDNGV